MIVCSLNEVEFYSRRAARGAGLPWGLAEEAGKASRWLAERGLPGVELLARLLKANDGRAYAGMAPKLNGQWHSADGHLCPVCTGAALSDHIGLLSAGHEIRLAGLAFPLLLAPFLDHSQRQADASYELRWPGTRALVFANGLELESEDDAAHLSEHVDAVTVSSGTHRNASPHYRPRTAGVKIPRSVWRVMGSFAKRT